LVFSVEPVKYFGVVVMGAHSVVKKCVAMPRGKIDGEYLGSIWAVPIGFARKTFPEWKAPRPITTVLIPKFLRI